MARFGAVLSIVLNEPGEAVVLQNFHILGESTRRDGRCGAVDLGPETQ